MIVEEAIVRANWRKNCPVMPLMNAQGMNTALRTRPTAITGAESWLIALMVASRGASPCSMWCSTASTTTMALSTTMPIASTRPKSVRLLRLKRMTAITPKVPMMATGTANRGMTAERQFCRNTSTTRATSTVARPSALNTSWMHSRVYGVVSYSMWYSMSAGKSLANSSILSWMRSAISRALASGNWKMIRPTDGRPSRRALTSSFLAAISMRATSRSRVMRPSGGLRRMMSPNCAGVCSRPRVVSVTSVTCPGRVGCWPMRPQATCWFCSRTAATTSPAPRLREASFSGSSQSRML